MSKPRHTRYAAALNASAAASAAASTTTVDSLRPTLGFGVPATSDPHHFKVIIPRGASAPVQVSEYLGLQALSDEHSVIDRAVLDRARWVAIRSEVQRAFNARLSTHGLRPSAWKAGENPVDRLLGKAEGGCLGHGAGSFARGIGIAGQQDALRRTRADQACRRRMDDHRATQCGGSFLSLVK